MIGEQRVYIIDVSELLHSMKVMIDVKKDKIKELSLNTNMLLETRTEYLLATALNKNIGLNVITRYIDKPTVEILDDGRTNYWTDYLTSKLMRYVYYTDHLYYLKTMTIHNNVHIVLITEEKGNIDG